jgi:hypothetical protein
MIRVNGLKFRSLLERTAKFAGDDPTMRPLQHIWLEAVDGYLLAMASDRYVLSQTEIHLLDQDNGVLDSLPMIGVHIDDVKRIVRALPRTKAADCPYELSIAADGQLVVNTFSQNHLVPTTTEHNKLADSCSSILVTLAQKAAKEPGARRLFALNANYLAKFWDTYSQAVILWSIKGADALWVENGEHWRGVIMPLKTQQGEPFKVQHPMGDPGVCAKCSTPLAKAPAEPAKPSAKKAPARRAPAKPAEAKPAAKKVPAKRTPAKKAAASAA